MRRILLQNVTAILLQNAIEIYYRMRRVFYYIMQMLYNKMRQLFKNCYNFIRKCDTYYKMRHKKSIVYIEGENV